MQSEYFIFDGIESSEMGLYIVRMDSGFIENPFTGGKTLKQEMRKNSVRPYFYGVEKSVLEFSLTLALLDDELQPKEWSAEQRMTVARWLLHDTYKSFQTNDDLGKIYYGIFTDATNIFTVNNTGYLEITFTTNSYCAWSPVIYSVFDLWNNPVEGTIVEIENISNINKLFLPKIEIEMKEASGELYDVQLINISNNNKEFSFTGLRYDEIISVDNENGIIISSYPIHINPYGSFNKQWFELVYGINQIKIIGKCKVTFESQFPIIR